MDFIRPTLPNPAGPFQHFLPDEILLSSKKVFGFSQWAAALFVMNERSDQELLREYAGRGSEEAFTALVKRHTSLVYGTACRKVSDPSLGEEITQTVFVILARKAPFLCHYANLSGWLHQTTLLECRQRIRTELRRQRREEIAMDLHTPENHSDLAQEVDDALLELSEKDRQPLLLRFFESLSLREVGSYLGIREDAAQKRVTKSLGLLEGVLRRRGRDIGSAALAVALAESAQSAPAPLAVSVAQTALTASGAATGLGLAFGKLMAVSKTQLAAACIVAIAAPLLFQTQRLQAARVEQQEIAATLAFHENRATNYLETIRRLNTDLSILEFDRQAALNGAKQRTAMAAAATKNLNSAALYRWSDSSPYVRLPKDVLELIKLTTADASEFEKRAASATNDLPHEIERKDPVDRKGNISDALAEALDLTPDQRVAATASLQHFAAQFDAVAAQHTTLTNSMPPGIDFQVPKDAKLVTLLTHEFPEEGQELKRQLTAELELQLGAERADTLLRQASSTLEHHFLNFGARKRWLAAAAQEDGMITIGRASAADDGTSLGGSVFTVSPDSVPTELRPYLPQSLFAKHE